MLNPQDPSYVEKTEDMVIYIVFYVFGNCAAIHICKIRAFIAGNKLQASLKEPRISRYFQVPEGLLVYQCYTGISARSHNFQGLGKLATCFQEVAQMCLRISKILFFGQVFLCGLETPVLKLQKSETGVSEYVSVVEASSTSSPSSPPTQVCSNCRKSSLSSSPSKDNAFDALGAPRILNPNFCKRRRNDRKIIASRSRV